MSFGQTKCVKMHEPESVNISNIYKNDPIRVSEKDTCVCLAIKWSDKNNMCRMCDGWRNPNFLGFMDKLIEFF